MYEQYSQGGSPNATPLKIREQRPKWKKILWIVLVLVLLAAVGAGVWFWKNQRVSQLERNLADEVQRTRELNQQLQEAQNAADATSDADKPISVASKIRGPMTFPSEGIPADMTVCAHNIALGATVCTKEQIKSNEFKTGVGYELTVKPGKHIVYAYRADAKDFQIATYDQYIKETILNETTPDICANQGMANPIIFDVPAAATVKDIVAGDWYYPGGFINCK
ncbi:MAG: hypothetical protein ACREGJ_02475 [Candidatus Saccharimonadales bacterium]